MSIVFDVNTRAAGLHLYPGEARVTAPVSTEERATAERLIAVTEELGRANGRTEHLLARLGDGGAANSVALQAELTQTQALRESLVRKLDRQLQAAPPSQNHFKHSDESSWQLAAELVEGIKGTSDNYVKLRAGIANSHSKFYTSITDLVAAIGKWTEEASKENVKFNVGAFVKRLDEIIGEWEGKALNDGAPVDIDALIEEYGAGVFVKLDSGDLALDTEVLKKMKNSILDSFGLGNLKSEIETLEKQIATLKEERNKAAPFFRPFIDSQITTKEAELVAKQNIGVKERTITQFNIWRTGFDGHEQQLQTKMRQAAERYSHANSKFDNLVSVLMKVLNGLYEGDKQFFS